ncbi:adenosylcobinamide-GDP ribazoletransferase [Desulfovibrio sp. SGI.169]|uniref:adenosylcobinamide-GDP ribazoletransferase n=1 Tax=Desulfovibrio sp. SGI.169 TaxID=3420561 RepID=UPI003D068503
MKPHAARLISAGGRFLDALAFLSRLAPPRPRNARALAACVPWFAPVGLVLGCLYTMAAWLFLRLFFASPGAAFFSGLSAWFAVALAAWFWLALELWTTRGLHWDGLADLGDACGSGASGARFREILKDSRLGVFGALSLLLVFSGQWLTLAWHLAVGHWPLLVLAPAWGRACAVWLAASAPFHNPASLGGLTCAGVDAAVRRLYCLAAFLLVCLLAAWGLGPWQCLFLLGAQWWLTRRLAATARRQGGLSGDFLGAAIELGQLCFLLATL